MAQKISYAVKIKQEKVEPKMASGGPRSGAGRRRKAPELKLVTGTYRADRDAKSNDDVPLGPMVAPLHLSETALTFFAAIENVLAEQKRSSPHYSEIAALLAQRQEQIARFQAVLDMEGDTYQTKTANGPMIRARPEVAMLSDALRHSHSLLSELMLTPSAALRIASGHKPEKGAFDDF